MINWLDPQVWILVSFLLFVSFVIVPFVRKAKQQLDDRSNRISRQLREVSDLYEETRKILNQQQQEFNNINDLINKIRLETEEEILALEKDKQAFIEKIQSIHNDRLEKQIKLIKDQYIHDVKAEAMQDVMAIVQNYISNRLTDHDVTKYSENTINSMSFDQDKKNERTSV